MSDPFSGLGIYQLDDRFRLSLPRGIETLVDWMDFTQSLECLAVPGSDGGLSLLSPEDLREHREIQEDLRGRRFRREDLGSSLYSLARSSVLAWEVPISHDRRLTLPVGARDLGLVPGKKFASVTLVAVGGVLEIWHPDKLEVQLQAATGRWAEVKRAAEFNEE